MPELGSFELRVVVVGSVSDVLSNIITGAFAWVASDPEKLPNLKVVGGRMGKIRENVFLLCVL